MLCANFLVTALTLVSFGRTEWGVEGQKTRAPNIAKRVVNAYCDSIGAHVVYDGGQRIVQKAKRGERCSDVKISDDQRAVGWLMESEAKAEGDHGKILQRWTQSDLFVNGIQVRYDETALYGWRFHNGGRQVVFEAGPLHGGGDTFSLRH
jgi:hypothetical protein